jgi:hypothetical protein
MTAAVPPIKIFKDYLFPINLLTFGEIILFSCLQMLFYGYVRGDPTSTLLKMISGKIPLSTTPLPVVIWLQLKFF